MAAGALSGLVAALETHRGRDRAVRALWLWLPAGGRSAGGPQASPSGLPGSLLAVSAQLSACRTALRLFDDFAMLRHSCGYGLGPKDEDGLVRGAVGALQRGQPAVLPLRARGVGSRAGIIRTSRSEVVDPEHGALGSGPAPGHPAIPQNLVQLRRKLRQHTADIFAQSQKEAKAQVKAEVLSILAQAADLSNAIHWLPPGFLWAGRFPPWLVGLLGTVSSLIGIYQASRGGNSEAV
ncbi:LOW QUALITY PROTEIN: peroxisomal membrane protein 11C [Strigops habroptila]|uniref:LOW QUALITY PROTEIN: peroxisomal membrane protein 11C n=1 Tax=Strigops habroptila TaxID=2489341 RepID=UPI0011CFDE11|nr:LOW QUALITY PROTEIN: peroxisomal membrane protein 11C [Strigops habroptila]